MLHIIAAPEKTPSAISIAAPATATRGAALTIHGTLSEFEGAITSPQILAVTKQDLSGAHALPNVTTSAAGSFSFGDTPQVGGPNTYTVSWAGDSGHLPASSHATVNVSRHATSISIATNRTTSNYHQAITVTARLRGTYNRRFVTIYAQPKGLARKAIKAGNVNSHGIIKVVAYPTRDTTFSAVFDGDYHYAPATTTRHALTRAAVGGKMLGWYANSHGYRVYHHAVNPTVTAHLGPNNKAGEKLCFPLQVYTGGTWRTLVQKCFAVDSAGTASIFVYGSNTVGISYRLRVQFGGDSTNAAANSTWYNFRFTT